jgi:TonB family protein
VRDNTSTGSFPLSMAEADFTPDVRENTSAGHLSVHVEGQHPIEVQFSFEQEPKRLGASLVASVGLQALAVALLIFSSRYHPSASSQLLVPDDKVNQHIVWLNVPGPGGGGGGGGNRMKEPPRKAELPGKDKITVPVEKPPKLEAPKQEAKKEPNPVEQLMIPAKTLGDAQTSLPGAIDGPPGPPTPSQGSGSGGGAGTGTGTGIGPGNGSGLGPGSGGGTGGGVFRPGSGITNPIPIVKPEPKYTSDAMRARIQGTVWVRCVVTLQGVCSDLAVERSLDSTFGLDEEAIKSVKLWKFRPGMRQGVPVPVEVIIEVGFTLR